MRFVSALLSLVIAHTLLLRGAGHGFGGVELLQAIASDRGQVVGQENVEDLPSQARNPFLRGVVATGVQLRYRRQAR